MNDGWCLECGDEFHLDDCGVYYPPCPGCGLCWYCCECHEFKGDEDDYLENERDFPTPEAT